MDSILNNEQRNGSFTSSKIVALTTTGKGALGFGAAAITYINETNIERMLGCSISSEVDAKPLSWGKLLEKRVHDLLPLDYTFSSDVTDVHPMIKYWAGSKDGMHQGNEPAVTDIKCPLTRKSFVQLVLPLYHGLTGMDAMLAIRNGYTHEGIDYPKHPDGEKYYCQLVSNAIINGVDHAELIPYMPYKSELQEIKELCFGDPKYYWLSFAEEEALPFIPDNGFFKNLNIIRFEIPKGDKEFLTACVLKAGTLLINNDVLGIAGEKKTIAIPQEASDQPQLSI